SRSRPRRSSSPRSGTPCPRASPMFTQSAPSIGPATRATSLRASSKRHGRMAHFMERIYRIQQGGDIGYAIERDGELRRASGDLFAGLSAGAPVAGGLAAVKVLAPVRPSKLVCVGLNYKDHAGEVGKALPPEPLLFLKP